MKYLSVDIETTGLDAKECQILEIGAVLADTEDKVTPPEMLPTFHKKLFFKVIRGEPVALAMNAKLISEMPPEKCGNYMFPHEIYPEFMHFISSHGHGKENKLTCAGKNFAAFDRVFLSALPVWSWCWCRHRTLDPTMMYYVPTDPQLPDTKKCIERSGLKWDEKKLHNAVDDARLVIHLIRCGEEWR